MPRPPFAALVLPLFLAGASIGCQEEPDNTRWEATQAETEDGAVAVANSGTAVDASEWNELFPEQEGDFDVVYKQEKRGTAIAHLEKDEVVLAQFSITDTAENPSARDKFADAVETIDGYPVVPQGRKSTVMLVNDRYQVKVASQDDSFTEADRKAWLEKFDLPALAAFDALK